MTDEKKVDAEALGKTVAAVGTTMMSSGAATRRIILRANQANWIWTVSMAVFFDAVTS